jgi:hypothetical protein
MRTSCSTATTATGSVALSMAPNRKLWFQSLQPVARRGTLEPEQGTEHAPWPAHQTPGGAQRPGQPRPARRRRRALPPQGFAQAARQRTAHLTMQTSSQQGSAATGPPALLCACVRPLPRSRHGQARFGVEGVRMPQKLKSLQKQLMRTHPFPPALVPPALVPPALVPPALVPPALVRLPPALFPRAFPSAPGAPNPSIGQHHALLLIVCAATHAGDNAMAADQQRVWRHAEPQMECGPCQGIEPRHDPSMGAIPRACVTQPIHLCCARALPGLAVCTATCCCTRPPR